MKPTVLGLREADAALYADPDDCQHTGLFPRGEERGVMETVT